MNAARPSEQVSSDDVQRQLEEIEYTGRKAGPTLAMVVAVIAFSWSLFQLWIASPLPSALWLLDVQKRGIHLAFALLLCFLMFPMARSMASRRIPIYDILLAIAAAGSALYLFFGYRGLVSRQGVLWQPEIFGTQVPFEFILGAVGIILLLEATRRSIGVPLVLVAGIFLLYSVMGPDVATVIAAVGAIFLVLAALTGYRRQYYVALPLLVLGLVVVAYAYFGFQVHDILAHKGVSLKRLIGYQWLGGEAIFGIPIDVSVSFVFLFVLFGALLDKTGAGSYFLDMAFALVGKYRGGPAKAAILASGMTGAISGSSIANVVTTGTFTIPVMRKIGLPAVKAGAIEVAASTNGQIMPPIMGAAAFIIAEFVGISYFEVVVAALVPALTSYIALFYISHLEALKLGLSGLPKADIPRFWATFVSGMHYLIPIIVLVYLLMIERWTASSAVFYSILWMMIIMLSTRVKPHSMSHAVFVAFKSAPVLVATALRWGLGLTAIDATLWGLAAAIAALAILAILDWRDRGAQVANDFMTGLADIASGMVAGARNMITIGVAVATAGIIVGAVSSTGLNNAMVGVVEAISGGNVYVILVMTAVLCIVLGMGLPTTANYIVVASLLAGVVVELGSASGLVLPLIAVHLFVFYFGLMADSTPPVCLAAFAASAISRADPLKTGVQSFLYDIRTAVLPFIFIFNTELLLIGVESWWHGIMIFVLSVIAIFCFSAVTQGWFFVKVRWYEAIALLIVMFALFRPDFVMNQFYPPFKPVDMVEFADGAQIARPGDTIRIHVTRETDYGDRLKLYRFTTPDTEPDARYGAYGVELMREDDGRFSVADMAFGGMAEQAGLDFGDYVTGVDVEQVGLPSKQWVYPFALALLGLVVAWQLMRRRREGLPASLAG